MKKTKPKSRFIYFLVPALFLVCLLLFLGGFLVNMYYGIKASEKKQIERMETLREFYGSDDFRPVNEQDFCDFNLYEALERGVKYNGLQYIATHNSYKEDLTFFSKTVFNVFGSFGGMKEKQFEYSMPTLTDQLNSGIRFFELDLNYIKRKGRWEIICVHNPILDNKSNAIDVSLAFEEIKLWSDNNPGHLPITIFIEPKSDYLFLPILKEFGINGINESEELIKDTFVDKLITPSQVLGGFGGYSSFSDMIEANGWPLLDDMLDKVLFVLFPKYNLEYIEMERSIKEQVFFMSEWYHSFDANPDKLKNNIPFIMTNEPDTLYNDEYAIEVFLSENFFVRTRLDFFPVIDLERKRLSMDLGAQLLTTDYPKGNTNAKDYYASFEDGYMVRIIPTSFAIF